MKHPAIFTTNVPKGNAPCHIWAHQRPIANLPHVPIKPPHPATSINFIISISSNFPAKLIQFIQLCQSDICFVLELSMNTTAHPYGLILLFDTTLQMYQNCIKNRLQNGKQRKPTGNKSPSSTPTRHPPKTLSHSQHPCKQRGRSSLLPLLPLQNQYSRRESNPNRKNRNLLFYPLNYGNRWIAIAKVENFCNLCKYNLFCSFVL